MKPAPADVAAALETLRKLLEAHPGAQDVVVCQRRDGRAELEFVTDRRYVGPMRRFVECAGWFELETTSSEDSQ
jgi:hypothetical protein